MPSTPFGDIGTSQVTVVIDQLAMEIVTHHRASYAMVSDLVQVIVWRTLHGQSAEQITAYLHTNCFPQLRPEFVAWVISEAGRRFRGDTQPGGGRR